MFTNKLSLAIVTFLILEIQSATNNSIPERVILLLTNSATPAIDSVSLLFQSCGKECRAKYSAKETPQKLAL